jgi:hypothetical protein
MRYICGGKFQNCVSKKKILFTIGSPNQTSQMHQISSYLSDEYDCWFTQFYPDYGYEQMVLDAGILENTIMSGHFKAKADKYLADHKLQNDYMAKKNDYDMTIFCTDLIVPRKLKKGKMVWVQEGMIDELTTWSKIVHKSGFIRRYFAMGTALNGSSNECDIYCVGSEGYKNFFERMGTHRDKMVVTGIPNFDNIPQLIYNDFPLRDYVLVATSDIRECFGSDDRIGFLKKCKETVAGRPVIFKLHPNEIRERAINEIKSVFGEDAVVYTDGNSNHMIANCQELITQFSTLVYVGIVLGKKVHSYFDLNQLYRLVPEQNGATSAKKIAEICQGYIEFKGSGKEFLSQNKPSQKSIAA